MIGELTHFICALKLLALKHQLDFLCFLVNVPFLNKEAEGNI